MVVTWIYGVDNFLDDIELMLGFAPYPRTLWKVVWKFLMPLIVMVCIWLLVISYYNQGNCMYEILINIVIIFKRLN